MLKAAIRPAVARATAITDVYDEERHTFLVRYPLSLVVGLALSGVLAVALTGFLGYPDDPPLVYAFFEHGWPLFLWLAAMLITLQASIFRHRSLRRELVASLTASLISILIVAIVYYYSFPVQALIQQIIQAILHQRILLRLVVQSPWLYAVINFGIIALYWADTAHRWRRRSRGLAPVGYVGARPGAARGRFSLPALDELIAGDLLVGALLMAVLALVFRSDVIQFLWNVAHASVSVSGCTVAWPFGACVPPGGGPHNPPTLTFIDLVLAMIVLPVGLLVLAFASLVSGSSGVDGVAGLHTPAHSATWDDTSTHAIAEQVLLTLWQMLRSILMRNNPLPEEPLPADAATLLLALRNILWPVLTLMGMFAAAFCADDIQTYLHSGKGIAVVLTSGGPAVAWGIAAHAFIVCSAALLVFRRRVVENSFRLMALVGFTLLLTLWIFTLALWAVNQFLLLTHATSRHPFDPPAWATAGSFAALAIFGFSRLILRRGSEGNATPPRNAGPEAPAQ